MRSLDGVTSSRSYLNISLISRCRLSASVIVTCVSFLGVMSCPSISLISFARSRYERFMCLRIIHIVPFFMNVVFIDLFLFFSSLKIDGGMRPLLQRSFSKLLFWRWWVFVENHGLNVMLPALFSVQNFCILFHNSSRSCRVLGQSPSTFRRKSVLFPSVHLYDVVQSRCLLICQLLRCTLQLFCVGF